MIIKTENEGYLCFTLKNRITSNVRIQPGIIDFVAY